MLQNPKFTTDDPAALRALVDGYPWATLVSATDDGLAASHYPMLWEDRDDDAMSLVTHLGRPDELNHRLDGSDVLVIVQGPHAYISTSWYPEGQFVPTWNHVSAHLTCRPEVLSAEENYAVLSRLVEHFEGTGDGARLLPAYDGPARAIARGTVGVRLHVQEPPHGREAEPEQAAGGRRQAGRGARTAAVRPARSARGRDAAGEPGLTGRRPYLPLRAPTPLA